MRDKNRFDQFICDIIAGNDKPEKALLQELESIVEEELQKSEDEMDHELIDSCIEILLQARDEQQMPPAAAPKPLQTKEKAPRPKQKKRLRKTTKFMIAAAVLIAIASFTLTASAKIFDFRIDEAILSLLSEDHAQLDMKNAESIPKQYSKEENPLIQELAENGFDQVILPDALINGDWTVEKVTYDKQNLISSVRIEIFQSEIKCSGSIDISRYNNIESGISRLLYNPESGTQFSVNGIDIITIYQHEESTSYYYDSSTETEYIILLQMEESKAIDILKTLE